MSAQAAIKTESASTYDDVPYKSFSHSDTHPSHISTVATLFGLTPPDFKTARVLELGCAGGGNLLPLALSYPDASFLGLDLSQEQITQAQQQKKEFNLKNIEFRQQDILTFASKEKFDYIICHGVFSWVPGAVQEKILKLCNESLSPQGMAVISYNTLPGWNAVRSLREMMLYHTNQFSDPAEKIRQARIFLDFLAENVSEGNKGYYAVIEDERNLLKGANDTYLYHDHLEHENTQFYFHDFVRLANAEGLHYVGDTSLTSMYLGNLSPKATEALKVLNNNIIGQEQYMDFIRNRRFRSSILCKDAQKINRGLQNEQIMNFFLTTSLSLETVNPDPKKNITFKAAAGKITTHDPITGALFLELVTAGERPVMAKDLVSRAQKKLGLPTPQPVHDALVKQGLQLVLRGFINLHSDSPHCVTTVSQKPVLFPLARHQAGLKNCQVVTNVLGRSVPGDIVSHLVMQNLDGTRTAEDLVNILVENVQNGALKIARNGNPVMDVQEVRREMTAVVNQLLPRLAALGLLIG